MWELFKHLKDIDPRRDSEAFLVWDNGVIKLPRKTGRMLISLEEYTKHNTEL